MMTAWSREQTLVAFDLYCKLPFGQFDQRNRHVINAAQAIGRTPSAMAMKLGNLASCDEAFRATDRKGLSGSSAADRAMWQEMQEDWGAFALHIVQALADFGLAAPAEPGITDSLRVTADLDHSGMDRLAWVKARVGQGLFRNAVLSAYNFRCCVTGVAVPELLVASHIVPWRSDSANRLNPANGLCLNALHDKAFDSGLMTIDAELTVVVSERIRRVPESEFQAAFFDCHGKKLAEPLKFRPLAAFLAFHREQIFEKTNVASLIPIAG